MKILFVISGLFDAGGAERVLTIMANHWAEQRHEVIIVTFDDGSYSPYYNLSNQLRHKFLDLPAETSSLFQGALANLKRSNKLKFFFKQTKPDVIISFLTNTNITTLLASLGTGLPVIISERNHPAYTKIDPVRKKFRSWLYPRADAVVCQTEGILSYYQPLLAKNGVFIPNPVLPADPSPSPPEIPLPEGRLLLAAGSMSRTKVYQKGFDMLIPVFSSLAQKHQDWHLLILGDGDQRNELLNQVKELSLADRIHLPGNVDNIQAIYNKADLFVLPSRYEGFPNVLCEAMASALPAVSFDCPTGPAEIIRHEEDGLLVPTEDTVALEKALNQLMSNDTLRKKLSEKAVEIVERFDLEKVMRQWESVLEKC